MESCRTASVIATGALLACGAIGACREAAAPVEIPPVTTATPDGGPLASSVDESADAGSVLAAALEPPVKAKNVMLPATLDAEPCARSLVAVTKGEVSAMGEKLATGDVLVVSHGAPFEAKGESAIVVWAQIAIPNCAAAPKPAVTKVVVRASAAPKLEWAGGTMSAHLDVTAGPKSPSPAPELYLGRLAGTAAVAEHDHPTSWEILAAHDASGTFTRGEGAARVEMRLRPGEIVWIPPGVKHSWRPDPGSKLTAVQMYAPPGPEQRFVALARDGGADAAAPVKDAGSKDAH